MELATELIRGIGRLKPANPKLRVELIQFRCRLKLIQFWNRWIQSGRTQGNVKRPIGDDWMNARSINKIHSRLISSMHRLNHNMAKKTQHQQQNRNQKSPRNEPMNYRRFMDDLSGKWWDLMISLYTSVAGWLAAITALNQTVFLVGNRPPVPCSGWPLLHCRLAFFGRETGDYLIKSEDSSSDTSHQDGYKWITSS